MTGVQVFEGSANIEKNENVIKINQLETRINGISTIVFEPNVVDENAEGLTLLIQPWSPYLEGVRLEGEELMDEYKFTAQDGMLKLHFDKSGVAKLNKGGKLTLIDQYR
ncbi:transcriptional regulator [Acrasis kona]|uniref:Transcriptional regulator n=1 Tax=Acrasis kona TaxID=1008807 RepID=A0AAW2YMS9_9EUKA